LPDTSSVKSEDVGINFPVTDTVKKPMNNPPKSAHVKKKKHKKKKKFLGIF